jgi:hypothetical protein
MFSVNGVSSSSGSAEDIYRDSAIQLELDARNAEYNQIAVSSTGAMNADSLRKYGANAKKAALLTGVGQALSSIGSVASMAGKGGKGGKGGK